MEYTRWYDNDELLSQLLTFIEFSDDRFKRVISADFIQIIMNEVRSLDNNEKIQKLKQKVNHGYTRWYDDVPNLESALEIMKDFDEIQRKEVIERVMESILLILSEGMKDDE